MVSQHWEGVLLTLDTCAAPQNDLCLGVSSPVLKAMFEL